MTDTATLIDAPAAPNTPDAYAGAIAATSLRHAYRTAREAGAPRHRDIAQQLGTSEGELIGAHVSAPPEGLRAQRLRGPWPTLVSALQSVGETMALTRNASCVHEKVGSYINPQHSGENARMGMVLGGTIDLRLFYTHWHHGFAVDETGPDKPLQRSLQFFDASGTAVHKVFARAATDTAAWDDLVERFADPRVAAAAPGLHVRPPAPRSLEAPDSAIHRDAFHSAWLALRDTHEFFGLLKAFGVTRPQALRLAEPRFAQPVEADSARDLLRAAAEEATPIMVFVGNPGTIQIHSGPVQRVVTMGPWLNVLDPGFNLHLREDHIAQAWAVRKPTTDGLVTSLELFDAAGDTIAMFFGERKPGKPELPGWRALVARLVADVAWQRGEAACTAC
jgi:putative hemin transport protein